MSDLVVHHDIFNNKIEPGKIVVTSIFNGDMRVCVVERCTPKMVSVRPVERTYTKLKYPAAMMVVDGEDVTAYILRNS